MLFELYSKYDPEELHRKLDGLVSRVSTQSASVGKSRLLHSPSSLARLPLVMLSDRS